MVKKTILLMNSLKKTKINKIINIKKMKVFQVMLMMNNFLWIILISFFYLF